MEFTPDDFKRMMFNVYEADMSKSFLTQFPELNVYEEFSKRLPTQLDRNKIIKWICYVYDKNSPYRVKYKDLTQRKVRAMIDAGHNLEYDEASNKEIFNEEIEDVILGKSISVADMTVAFCKLHCDVDYSHLVLLEAMYYKLMRDVFLGNQAKITDLQKIKDDLANAIATVLQNDQAKSVVKSLYQSINKDKIKLSPEDIAISIQDNGLKQTIRELNGEEQD